MYYYLLTLYKVLLLDIVPKVCMILYDIVHDNK